MRNLVGSVVVAGALVTAPLAVMTPAHAAQAPSAQSSCSMLSDTRGASATCGSGGSSFRVEVLCKNRYDKTDRWVYGVRQPVGSNRLSQAYCGADESKINHRIRMWP
ncbi:hypothetical protein [Pseudonocardia alni]|uniref:hypothetical protein n=1 Tax=Pseudonocardia alni TaxID=33907 RepID=UPI00280A5122|nr:hypothetical protein [Pseudonocardia alni]